MAKTNLTHKDKDALITQLRDKLAQTMDKMKSTAIDEKELPSTAYGFIEHDRTFSQVTIKFNTETKAALVVEVEKIGPYHMALLKGKEVFVKLLMRLSK